MSTVTGYVQEVSNKAINTRRGKATIYSFRVDDQWYKTGFDNPAGYNVHEGAYLKFDFANSEYGKEVDVKSIEAIEPPKENVSAAKANVKQSKDGYWANKEQRDQDNDLRYNARAAYAFAVDRTKFEYEIGAFGTKAKATPEAVSARIEQLYHKYLREFMNVDALDKILLSEDFSSESPDVVDASEVVID